MDGAAVARPPAWRQVALVLAVLGLYLAGAGWQHHAGAQNHARDLLDVERRLHVDVERPLNEWLAGRGVLRTLANYEYALVYVVVAFVVLLWIYIRRPAHYRHAKTSFLLVNVIGIGCFFVYPVAPPRMFAELGYVDTVALGRTVGSWGWSPVVAHANSLAAMPSLHVAWSLWALAMLVRISRRRLAWLASGVQVAVTTVVIMATANHWLLDAVAGAILVAGSVLAANLVHRHADGQPLAPADSFFVHVDSPIAPQQVGGLVRLGTEGGAPSREDLERVARAALPDLPRFRQRLVRPTRWRRARWVDHPDLDWAWHVPEYDVSRPEGGPGGAAAVSALVAELAAVPLPYDRPLWRLGLIRGASTAAETYAFLLVHHAVADGFGVIAQALHLTATPPTTPPTPLEAERRSARSRPLRTAAAITVGLAQLATDGRPSGRLPGGTTGERRFGTASVPLDVLRSAAHRQGVRITDVVLAAVAGALRRVRPEGLPAQLRVAVPLMARRPGSMAPGNLTAGVITDVPLGELAEAERLERTANLSGPLRTGTRVLASATVLRVVGAVLPPVLHARFARAVYGPRYFHAIVSNVPGPRLPLTLAGAPVRAVFPILPLAPGAPLAVGVLGWEGAAHIGVAVEPGLLDDAAALCAAIVEIIGELGDLGELGRGAEDRPRVTLGARGRADEAG